MNTIADFYDETLCCIAKTYEDDTRFKDYFNSYDNQNLASYISEAVNYFLVCEGARNLILIQMLQH